MCHFNLLLEQISTSLDNINRQIVNKLIWGRLGDNQPYKVRM